MNRKDRLQKFFQLVTSNDRNGSEAMQRLESLVDRWSYEVARNTLYFGLADELVHEAAQLVKAQSLVCFKYIVDEYESDLRKVSTRVKEAETEQKSLTRKVAKLQRRLREIENARIMEMRTNHERARQVLEYSKDLFANANAIDRTKLSVVAIVNDVFATLTETERDEIAYLVLTLKPEII